MKNLTTYLLLVISAILLSACQKTLDTSSDEAMKQSVIAVKESLPQNKQEEFTEALGFVQFEGMDLGELMYGDSDKATSKIDSVLHGMTGEEVIAMAHKIRKEREAKKKDRKK